MTPTPISRAAIAMRLLAGVALMSAGCASPIEVARKDPHEVERELDSNVISTGRLSAATAIVLHRADLRFDRDPEGAIARLHERVAVEKPDRDALFALAEMSFYRAEDTGGHAHFLAAAVYAYAFLFPEDPRQRPSAFDPRFRTACDIYNRSITWAFASPDRTRFDVHSGEFALPFGSIDIAYDPAGAHWGDQALSDFTPADELGIDGLSIRYRRPGIGASLAADATPKAQREGFQLEPGVKVPVSPKISAHSIIAVEGDGPVETGDDGVVSYSSAHIPEAESELVVRASHSVQADPHTVAEVRRILLLHLAQACPTGCTPAAAMGPR